MWDRCFSAHCAVLDAMSGKIAVRNRVGAISGLVHLRKPSRFLILENMNLGVQISDSANMILTFKPNKNTSIDQKV